jgi:hypothetical protein
MPFNAASVDAVKDACEEMQQLRAISMQAILSISDSPAGVLTDQERDDIRARMNQRIQNRRNFVINQVSSW